MTENQEAGKKIKLVDSIGLKMLIDLVGEDILPEKKDKNAIYVELQDRMAEVPELAAFVADMMSKSLTLEEAQLIGKTALVVFEVMKEKDELVDPIEVNRNSSNS